MKITKTASGKTEVKISKSEWKTIGKKAGWMKTAQDNRPGWMLGETPKSSTEMFDFIEDRFKTIRQYLDMHIHPNSIIDMAIEVGNTLVDDMPAIIRKEFETIDEPPDYEDNMSDVEADADTLSSAGWGTDEDYGSGSDII